MSTGSSIEWTDATWNPVVGCTRVPNPGGGESGCDHCYAVKQSHRLEAMGQAKYAGLTVLNGRGERHFNGTVRCVEEVLTIPLRWRKPRRIFVNSMSDLFHERVPFEYVYRVLAVMAITPHHTYQVLTKRPERMAECLADPKAHALVGAMLLQLDRHPIEIACWPLPNVWLGTSCENQAALEARWPHLRRCPAAVRFISAEPLLGEIDIGRSIAIALHKDFAVMTERGRPPWPLHWVIAGGESGGRMCRVEHLISLREQCTAAAIPFYLKQLGQRPALDYYCDDDVLREWALARERCVWDRCIDHDGRTTGLVKWGGPERDGQPRTGSLIEVRVRRKGGDPDEWPEELRVREYPAPHQRPMETDDVDRTDE